MQSSGTEPGMFPRRRSVEVVSLKERAVEVSRKIFLAESHHQAVDVAHVVVGPQAKMQTVMS